MMGWRWAGLSLVLGSAWLGCSDDPKPTPDGGTSLDAGSDDGGTGPADGGVDGGTSGRDGGTDAGSSTAVRVWSFTRYLTANGFVDRPDDVSHIQLLVEEGDQLVPIPGRDGGPGESVFPDVPRVTYYLRWGHHYVVTDSRDLDLSGHRLGRPDFVTMDPDHEPTADIALQGLETVWRPDPPPPFPTNPADPEAMLRVTSPQVGYSGVIDLGHSIENSSWNARDVSFYHEVIPAPHIEPEKGDRVWVVQLNPRLLGALPDGGTQNYLTAVRGLELPPLAYDGGQPFPIQGTFQRLTMNELPLDWQISRFAAHAAEVNPAATLSTSLFRMEPTAYGPAESWVGYAGTVVEFQRPRGEPADARGTLVYGNPYPASWGLVAMASTSFRISYQIPGASLPAVTSVTSFVRGRPSDIGSGPIVPRIRPPLELTLDGTELYTSRTITSGGHVLAWRPPAAGTPNAYVVSLRRLMTDPNIANPYFVPAGFFYTRGSTTSVRLPSGLLQPGNTYFLTVRAVLAPGYDVSNKPFVIDDMVDYSAAHAMSGLLTVPPETP
ncbi:fibronectin type III domain-containing protein [Pyxidicoccus fallax]|uniref:Fibronectin type III domain-containing protein n=1 Tax=Pyxidicoccus fallax TaxID=394095 RepID=A0A848LNK8_9BACT|nr:fibronectin type III domain-containing protein [Pyxidicoccus fallax]NMO19326.1 fibronectin type III domain-containing protein [Pyxidicoccus fallax]NPC80018.1 fibronectin type III domain-containing protein [Pyxidicoccus fallax]